MPRFMLPRYVEVVDDLPRTEASMRVRKHEIRARGVTDATYDRGKAVGSRRSGASEDTAIELPVARWSEGSGSAYPSYPRERRMIRPVRG